MYQTLGIVIKKTDFGEADRLLTIFSKEFGKVEVLAKSIRKIDARLAGHSELFCQSNFMFSAGKHRPVLTGALIVEHFPFLRRTFENLRGAFQIADLLNAAIAGPQKDQAIWRLVSATLRELNGTDAGEIPKIISFFQINLLARLGHRPELWKCVACGKKLRQEGNLFSPAKGGVLCHQCVNPRSSTFPVTAETIKILRIFLTKGLPWIKKLTLKKSELTELEFALNRFIGYHLG